MKLANPLQGQNVTLRTLMLGDASRCVTWLNNPDVTRYLARQYTDLTLEKELAWIASMRESELDLVAAICIGKGRHIGNVGLHQIDRVNGHAEIGIFIGRTNMHCRGIGREAVRMLVTHALAPIAHGGLGLHKVWAHVFGPNAASRCMCERAGLEREGILREHHALPDGRRVNIQLFAAFADAWNRGWCLHN